MKKGIKYCKKKWLESLLKQRFVRTLYITTNTIQNAVFHKQFRFIYIRAAGGSKRQHWCSWLFIMFDASGFAFLHTPKTTTL
jgi:hypothetical protein